MRAVVFDDFGTTPQVREVPDPVPPEHGVVVEVAATGLCRSDWHGWRGHDPDIRPPHVPGHEFAGVIAAVGAGVRGHRLGQRVTAPFVCACGTCPQCLAGDQQVCANQTQPGFTHWGSFAQYVAVHHADVNLVALPDSVRDGAAAALGCRFATAFRAVVEQGRVRAGQWLVVYGCGGVGLSAVMIAAASGARVVAVDIYAGALELARRHGATVTVDATDDHDGGVAAVRAATDGGAHVSIDALGSEATCVAAIRSLRRRGRHVQVGLLPAVTGYPALPMDLVIGHELELLGSHGMAAHAYPGMLALVTAGVLRPDLLVADVLALDAAPTALAGMDDHATPGIRLIDPRLP